MTNLTPERVKRAREWVENYMPEASELRDTILSALAILDDYSKVKAENEGLWGDKEELRKMNNTFMDTIAQLGAERDALKAELDAARPLIEAVMGIDAAIIKAGVELHTIGLCRPILRAALALRKKKMAI
jgi:hypothetical protein